MPIRVSVDVPSYNNFFVVSRAVVFLWFSYSNTLAGVVNCKVNTLESGIKSTYWMIHPVPLELFTAHTHTIAYLSLSLRAMQCFYFHCFYSNSNTYMQLSPRMCFRSICHFIKRTNHRYVWTTTTTRRTKPTGYQFNHEFRSNAVRLFILKHQPFLVTQFQFFRFGFIAQLHACSTIFYYVDAFF